MKDITFEIYVISRLTHGFYARELAKFGITTAQFPYVMAIIDNDGISQEKLTRLLRMGKSTTATVVKQLLEKGLISREVDENDRRNFKLHASEKAVRLKPEIAAVIERCNQLIAGEIGETDSFFDVLTEVRKNTESKIGGRLDEY